LVYCKESSPWFLIGWDWWRITTEKPGAEFAEGEACFQSTARTMNGEPIMPVQACLLKELKSSIPVGLSNF
jgi:hypothetical protein